MDRLKALLEKLQWVHVVLVVGLAGAFFYFTLDHSELESREQSIGLANSQINSLQKKVDEAKEFERQFEDKKKKFVDLTNELQRLQGALPRQLYLPDLLSELLREAKQLEIDVTSIRSDERETQHELFNSLGFTIDAKGTFLQFFIFIDRLANLKRLLTLAEVKIDIDTARPSVTLGGEEGAFAQSRLSGGRSPYPGVSGRFRILTYRYRQPVTTSPATGAKDGGK